MLASWLSPKKPIRFSRLTGTLPNALIRHVIPINCPKIFVCKFLQRVTNVNVTSLKTNWTLRENCLSKASAPKNSWKFNSASKPRKLDWAPAYTFAPHSIKISKIAYFLGEFDIEVKIFAWISNIMPFIFYLTNSNLLGYKRGRVWSIRIWAASFSRLFAPAARLLRWFFKKFMFCNY